MTRLSPGDRFPDVPVTLAGGATAELPAMLAGHFGVVLFYRGAWCPFCNEQLKAFQDAASTLAEVDVHVVALSVDDEETTRALVERHGLEFPVGHGADADELARRTDAFVNADPRFVQATGFVLAPDGSVIVSVYSSGAIGRLAPEHVAGLVRYVRAHAQTS